MHPDVVDDRPGTCPVCKMKLQPVRLDTVWSCPVHAAVVRAEGGRCPICQRELVPMTMAVSWTCPGRRDVPLLQPRLCDDGRPAQIAYTTRPHGNHNPQHGGQFFMAADNWHHLEGEYPRAGVFRLYVYDDYSKPLAAAQLRRVTGKVTTAKGEAPLAVVRGQNFLEGRIDDAAPPVSITAKVAFTPGGPENRFDFTFTAYSSDAVSGPSRASGPHATYTNTDQALAQLRDRSRELAEIIDRGAFGELYVPAFAAKDLALAIQSRAPADASSPGRAAIEAATSRIVRAAWMLDAAGDLGNRDSVSDAYAQFKAALSELEAAIAGTSR